MKLTAVLLTLVWLSACNSSGFNKNDQERVTAAGTKVVVEDRSATSFGVETEVIAVGKDHYQGTALNDPASLLANRIVYFGYDSRTVRPEYQAILAAHTAYLAGHPNVMIRLIGHTDERGSREYNLALGEHRALGIRQILMLHGASINQFDVISYGEERPQVEGFDELAWQQNRRVELIYKGQ